MPDFTGFGFTGYGYGYTYLHYLDPIFQYTANATWVKGSHNIRFGVDVDQQHMNQQETNPTSFGFNGGATSLNGGPGTNTYNQFGDFLLGLPQSEQNSQLTTPYVLLRTWQYSLYIRDQWQVSRKLTLSYGTRWEYYPVPTRGSRGIESFNLNTATITVCGVAGNPRDCNYTVSKRQFSPRIGIAYRPTEKTRNSRGILLESRADQHVSGRHLQLSGAARLRSERIIDLRSDWAVVRGNPGAAPGEYQRRNSADSVRPELRRPGRDSAAEFRSRLHRDVELHAAERPRPRMEGASRDMSGTLTIHQHTGTTSTTARWAGGSTSQPLFGLGITGSMNEILPYETMHYNSFQSSLQRRFANGFTFQAAYTRSKQIGTCCDDSGDGGPAIPIAQYTNLNRALDGRRPP